MEVTVIGKKDWFSTFAVKDEDNVITVNTVDIYTYQCSEKECGHGCKHEAAVIDYVTSELDKYMKAQRKD